MCSCPEYHALKNLYVQTFVRSKVRISRLNQSKRLLILWVHKNWPNMYSAVFLLALFIQIDEVKKTENSWFENQFSVHSINPKVLESQICVNIFSRATHLTDIDRNCLKYLLGFKKPLNHFLKNVNNFFYPKVWQPFMSSQISCSSAIHNQVYNILKK